jgi:hypothetical protein
MPRLPPPQPPTAATRTKPSPVRRWMREILITGAVLLIVALILAKGLTAEVQALIVGGAALIGAVYYTVLPVAEESKSRRVAAGTYVFAAVWLAAAGYPFFKLVSPGDPVKRVSLASEGTEQSLGKLPAGHYLLLAEMPRSAVTSDANYVLTVRSAGHSTELSGEFMRATFHTRAGRKGRGVTESIHSADYHDVKLDAGEATIRLDSFERAGAGLDVELFANAAPYGEWLAIQGAVVVVAALLDALFAGRKRRSTITVGACFTLLFYKVARDGIRPGNLIRPLIGAGIAGLIGGMAAGYLLNWLARLAAGAVRRRRA